MASISNDPGGRKRILFIDPGGTRRTIRLGRLPKNGAETVRLRVEHLLSAKIVGLAPDRDTSRWLTSLDDKLHERLARVDLIAPRASERLRDFLARYIDSRSELKPASIRKLEQTRDKLLAYFDPETPLRALTPDSASNWRVWLLGESLSVATVKQHIGNTKTIFNDAINRGLLDESPFMHLKGGTTASRNTRYVTPDETTKVLEACPSLQWRLLVAIARFAGLRTPSETHLLTWTDVDWERGRMRVRSPKTEHHPGHEERLVPITPELIAVLEEGFAAAPEGQEQIITLKPGGQLGRALRRIVRHAGVEVWKDTFQTLRRSCEKQWAETFPQYAVSKWIGHSITVSGKHYANSVPDELFDRAAAQNTAQHPAVFARNTSQTEMNQNQCESRNSSACDELQDYAPACERANEWSRGESNPQLSAVAGYKRRCVHKYVHKDCAC